MDVLMVGWTAILKHFVHISNVFSQDNQDTKRPWVLNIQFTWACASKVNRDANFALAVPADVMLLSETIKLPQERWAVLSYGISTK